MEHMGVELHIPLGIAEKRVELIEGRIQSLIAPSEAAVLKVYLFKVACVKGRTETIEAATIYVSSVLVSSPVDLVEIAWSQPFYTIDWLLCCELIEEVNLPTGGGRPINRSDQYKTMTIAERQNLVVDMSVTRIEALSQSISLPPRVPIAGLYAKLRSFRYC